MAGEEYMGTAIKCVLGRLVQVDEPATFEEFCEQAGRDQEPGLMEVQTREFVIDCAWPNNKPSRCTPACAGCRGSGVQQVWLAYRPAMGSAQ